MQLFFEGVEAVAQPCTVPLLVSAFVFIVVAGANAPIAASAHLVGVAVVAWLRFTRLLTVDLADGPAVVAGSLVALSALAVALAPVRWRRRAAGVGAATGGAVAALVWRPCVGFELGSVLDSASTDRLAAFIPVFVYVAGVLLVSLAVGLAPVAIPRLATSLRHRWVMAGGATAGVVLGGSMAAGLWSDIVDELFRLSSA